MRAAGLMTCLALVGCGRIGFPEDRGDAGPPADAHADAPPGTTLVSFGETPSATHMGVTTDAFLHGGSIGHNFGGSRYVSVLPSPAHVGLLRFELSVLPPGTIVEAASLHLRTELTSAGPFAMFELLEEWQEGNKDGSTDECSWTNRLPATAWSVAGAGPPESRSTLSLAVISPTTSGPLEIAFDGAAIELVQRWIAEPGSNRGLAFVGEGEALEWTFSSRESFTMDARPVLELAIR